METGIAADQDNANGDRCDAARHCCRALIAQLRLLAYPFLQSCRVLTSILSTGNRLLRSLDPIANG
jgi:hypothetical protein